MRTPKVVLIATFAFLLQGCAAPELWSRANTSEDDYNKDAAQCNAQMWSIPNGTALQMAMFAHQCMKAKGYVKVPAEKK